jgi:hypothetical protein
MSTILFIHRHRMLQQAVAVSLFPEHDVRVADSIPETAAVDDVDLVIVDGASPDDPDGLVDRAAQAVRQWNIPVVWVEGAGSLRGPKRDKMLVIQTPIQKAALQAAVAELLVSAAKSAPGSRPPARVHEGASSHAAEAQGPAVPTPAGNDKKVIDLLEVVVEPLGPTRSKSQQTKQ